MKIEWSAWALDDRERIFAYLHERNSAAAAAVDRKIGRQIGRLAEHPESGRIGRVTGTRGLVIGKTPYVGAYIVASDCLRVLRILHGSRQWPEYLTP